MSFLGETLRVLLQTYLPKPVCNLCHCGEVSKPSALLRKS